MCRRISMRRFAWVISALLMHAGLAASADTPPPAPLYLHSQRDACDLPARDGSFDYERREAMIPMRDGVKLHTVILIPKGAHGTPILLTRTPYEPTS